MHLKRKQKIYNFIFGTHFFKAQIEYNSVEKSVTVKKLKRQMKLFYEMKKKEKKTF